MLTLAQVITGTQGRLVGALRAESPVSAFAIDSRRVTPGAVFFALSGTSTDGHAYLADVANRGACAAVVREDWLALHPSSPLPTIAVPETLAALHNLAAWWRGMFPQVPVIGITGSVGKTSTKEAIAAVLGTRYRVLKTPGNLNAITSMPLVLLDMTPETEVAVIEMSLYDAGEIATMARIAAPAVGVVTTIGMSHVERLGSQAAIIANKGDLVASLPPDGYAVLNGDDPHVRDMAQRTTARIITFGMDGANTVRATALENRGLGGIAFRLHLPGGAEVPVTSPMLGMHNAYAALAAAAVGHVRGVSAAEIARGLAEQRERLRLTIAPGPQGANLIDDTYNSSPQSAIAALDLLASLDATRHIAVLADMFELGAYSDEAHRIVGAHAAQTADRLYTLGPLSVTTAVAAREAGMVADAVVSIASDDKESLVAHLRADLAPGDTVLVKGSRGMHMDALIAALRTDTPIDEETA